ncbi:MAG: bifunctional 23S rRNA (guanine(2069)-N(7))-methyltransferase RlmK/23S rRNA (guanine(2445)-N(2))-methyltransferase RlmL [bacterium]|nr:MAG: bifunctional 23S rRNA (guanine(2069)-N(7))-methyltransferase RlmK/23S rRNA (guanine(2445)-N(2))-methyltransferase RlmL [bacterium]
MQDVLRLFATCPKGVNDLLAAEVGAFGGSPTYESAAGVAFTGTLEAAYRACLWSRVASRILLPLAELEVGSADDLYEGGRAFPWEEHFSAGVTMAVDASGRTGPLTHSHYAALKVKDAVVDRLRDLTGRRPSVDLRRPDIRINLRLNRGRGTLSLDLSGESLHQRGYRLDRGEAPLKENLAAAILIRAGWPRVAADGGPLVDPMCGSATLPIEAALMAADVAPAIFRTHFGFLNWKGHDGRLWERLQEEARSRGQEGMERRRVIVGYDSDRRAVRGALANLARAGLAGRVHVERRDLSSLSPPEGAGGRPGLLVANPPYGERLGRADELRGVYAELGDVLRTRFQGWRAAVFTGDPDLGKAMGIRAVKINNLYNGPIRCRLLHFDVREEHGIVPRRHEGPVSEGTAAAPIPGMFANRLRKNIRTIGRWAKRNGIECYRVYDGDIPEYNLSVDIYGSWIQVAEYEAPARVQENKAAARVKEALEAISDVLAVPGERIVFKVRRRQRGVDQYGKHGDSGHFIEVGEAGFRFLVNLTDYLDTGLFLDHRPTRAMIGSLAKGRRFLNLFCYTGTATVFAAGAGARFTTSVDLSRTYLDWARRNMDLNSLAGPAHRFVRADCLRWLEKERGRYGLIFLDPPTFSASKGMVETLDVQRDHVRLVTAAARLLDEDGTLLFSNNRRDFKMDRDSLAGLHVEDITGDTVPRDFARNPRVHNCWRITRKD